MLATINAIAASDAMPPGRLAALLARQYPACCLFTLDAMSSS